MGTTKIIPPKFYVPNHFLMKELSGIWGTIPLPPNHVSTAPSQRSPAEVPKVHNTTHPQQQEMRELYFLVPGSAMLQAPMRDRGDFEMSKTMGMQ